MPQLEYLDFDLQIERSGAGYVAEVIDSPAGQARHAFGTPFSDLEIENFLLRMGQSRQVMRRIDSPETAAAKTFGNTLFNTVFGDDVRACLISSLDQAREQGRGLRIRLRLSQAPDLADLPWEYLHNATLNRFLALSVDTPLVRYLELAEKPRPLKVELPLRVLVMIASPSDYAPLNVEREWSSLNEATADLQQRGLIRFDRLDTATMAELQRYLRREQYHIFHFIGHGGFDSQTQDGMLILEEQSERSQRVSGQDIGTLLYDHRSLRLALLNACEGARASRQDPFAGVAQSLVQQCIPAVVAMQFAISDAAATTFAHDFYTALADGYPVDGALTEARKGVFAGGYGTEWGTPVLYMRADSGQIFEVGLAPAAASGQQPATSSQRTADSGQQPADSGQQPAGTKAAWPIVPVLVGGAESADTRSTTERSTPSSQSPTPARPVKASTGSWFVGQRAWIAALAATLVLVPLGVLALGLSAGKPDKPAGPTVVTGAEISATTTAEAALFAATATAEAQATQTAATDAQAGKTADTTSATTQGSTGTVDNASAVLSVEDCGAQVALLAPDSGFDKQWRADDNLRTRIGCPQEQARSSRGAYGAFRHGLMIWWEADPTIYVLYDKQEWTQAADTYVDGEQLQAVPPDPDGGLTPERGFGKLWRNSAQVQNELGYMIDPEQGLWDAVRQDFQNGMLLWVNNPNPQERKIFVLFKTGELWVFDDPNADLVPAS